LGFRGDDGAASLLFDISQTSRGLKGNRLLFYN
jgi:hypothetical protein